jgi:hypothetical protein
MVAILICEKRSTVRCKDGGFSARMEKFPQPVDFVPITTRPETSWRLKVVP